MEENSNNKPHCTCDVCLCVGFLVAWMEGFYLGRNPELHINEAARKYSADGADAMHNSPMLEMLIDRFGMIVLTAALARLALPPVEQSVCADTKLVDPNDVETQRMRDILGQ